MEKRGKEKKENVVFFLMVAKCAHTEKVDSLNWERMTAFAEMVDFPSTRLCTISVRILRALHP